MAGYEHDWDSLPGESSSQIVDLEAIVKRMTKSIDNGDTSYGIAEMRTDLEEIRDLATKSLADIDRATT